MNPQLQQLGQLIGLALSGDEEALQTVVQQILPQLESQASDFRNLAVFVRLLLKGEQDQSKLETAFTALDPIDKAIVQLALQTANHGQAEAEGTEAETDDEKLVQLIVLACGGDQAALTIVTGLIEELQNDKATRELGKALERLIVDEERNPAILTRKLDETGKALVASILEKL